jgi:hypothetical protein
VTLPRIALSVRQPWAWAILHAGKDVENRSFGAMRFLEALVGERIAIHASKGMTRDEFESALLTFADARFRLGQAWGWPRPFEFPRGAIVGAVTVTGVVRESPSPWFFGPCALTLKDPAPCDPIPAKGQLGAFEWSPSGELDPPAKWMNDWPNAKGRSLFDEESP